MHHTEVSLHYSEQLSEYRGDFRDIYDTKSLLSVTVGDWKTGIHTGTVEVFMDDVDMILAYFTVQSDQLPSCFINTEDHYSRGLLLHPLPFAKKSRMQDASSELNYLAKQFSYCDWTEVKNLFADYADVIQISRI